MGRKNDDSQSPGAIIQHLLNGASNEREASGRCGVTKSQLANTAARGICRYLKVSVWRSEALYRLPSKGDGRLLYLFLLTGPHTLSCHVPGLYQVGRESLREELRLKPQPFHRALRDLEENIGVKTDFGRCLVWVPTALEHMGPPANPNIVQSYCRALKQMPKSPLVEDALLAYGPFLADLGVSFAKPFQNCFPRVPKTAANGFEMVFPAPEEPFRKEIEIEKEKEREGGGSGGVLGPSDCLRAPTTNPGDEKTRDWEASLERIRELRKALE